MIELQNLSKSFGSGPARKVIADEINAVFPTGQAVALMGRNGAGKSTLLQIIAGNMDPDAGQVCAAGTVSYPVGFSGTFHKDLTGSQNAKFIARIYGVDTDELVNFVQNFAELDGYFHKPVRNYSSGMRSRLAFGVSMALQFDTYLVDEVTSVGDKAFREKSAAIFKDRMKNASAIVVTHSLAEVRNLCNVGAVLEAGKLHFFDQVNDAIALYVDIMDRSKPT